MKVCVSSTGTGSESAIDPRFGRASHLLLVDTETGDLRPIPNDPGAARGAGIQAAEAVVRSGASAVLTGQLGPKAFAVLQAAGIPAYGARGLTVQGAILALSEGRLSRITDALGQPHGGLSA
jgi:predicted Fe-Mo cluster-binding NifX family protein